MPPNIPQLDYTLAGQWMSQVLDRLWPFVAVILGTLVGVWVFRAFRRSVERD
jgi:predicted permease